jgi:hypothetical protein
LRGAELQPFIVAAFPAPFNITVLGHTVEVDTTALLTPLITLVLAQVNPTRTRPALWPLLHNAAAGSALVQVASES